MLNLDLLESLLLPVCLHLPHKTWLSPCFFSETSNMAHNGLGNGTPPRPPRPPTLDLGTPERPGNVDTGSNKVHTKQMTVIWTKNSRICIFAHRRFLGMTFAKQLSSLKLRCLETTMLAATTATRSLMSTLLRTRNPYPATQAHRRLLSAVVHQRQL